MARGSQASEQLRARPGAEGGLRLKLLDMPQDIIERILLKLPTKQRHDVGQAGRGTGGLPATAAAGPTGMRLLRQVAPPAHD